MSIITQWNVHYVVYMNLILSTVFVMIVYLLRVSLIAGMEYGNLLLISFIHFSFLIHCTLAGTITPSQSVS